MATRKYAYCQEPSKIILPLTAQRICAISSSRDKNSCHSFAKLSAWWLAPIAVCRKSPPVVIASASVAISRERNDV